MTKILKVAETSAALVKNFSRVLCFEFRKAFLTVLIFLLDTFAFQGDWILSTRIFHRFQVLARGCGTIGGCKFFSCRFMSYSFNVISRSARE